MIGPREPGKVSDTTGKEASPVPGWHRPVLWGIVLAAAILRLSGLGQQSLWIDEVLTHEIAASPHAALVFDPPAATNIPPLYYLVVHLFLMFGEGEVFLRLPSALAGIATVGVAYVVLARWLAPGLALLVCGWLAVSPFQIWYGQEARPYTLLTLLALLSAWAFQRLRTRDARGERSGKVRGLGLELLFAATAAAPFACHTIGIAWIGVLLVCVLALEPRSRWLEWARRFVLVAILLVPSVLLLASYPVVPVPPKESASALLAFPPYALWTFLTGYTLGPTLTELHAPRPLATVLAHAPLVVPVVATGGLLLVLGIAQAFRRREAWRWPLTGWLLAPFVLGFTGTLASGQGLNVRHVILAHIPALVFLGAGILTLPGRALRGVALVFFAALSVAALVNLHGAPEYGRADNRAAARWLGTAAVPGDVVIASAPYVSRCIRHYAPDLLVSFPPHPELAGPPAERRARLAAFLERTQARSPRDRIWLLLSRTFHGDADGHLEALLGERMTLIQERRAAGIRLLEFRR